MGERGDDAEEKKRDGDSIWTWPGHDGGTHEHDDHRGHEQWDGFSMDAQRVGEGPITYRPTRSQCAKAMS